MRSAATASPAGLNAAMTAASATLFSAKPTEVRRSASAIRGEAAAYPARMPASPCDFDSVRRMTRLGNSSSSAVVASRGSAVTNSRYA